jgi:ADP-heptose:LPS heptosyltransferase
MCCILPRSFPLLLSPQLSGEAPKCLKMERDKILIFKLGLLGDVLMTTPFVRQLRRIFPHAEIQYWVGGSYRAALEGNHHLSSIVDFDERLFFQYDLRAAFQLWRKLRKERFEIGFFLGKHWIFNAFSASLGIPRRIGFARESISRLFLTDATCYRDLRHEVYYYLDLLRFVGDPDYADVKMDVSVARSADERVEIDLDEIGFRSFVAVINSGGNNAGETQFARRLPVNFFENLVFALSKKQPVALLGNAADREHYAKFSFPENVKNLAGKLTFQESLAVMKRAARVFSTDCGGMHMAACVNEHLTAFFGPAHPERKAPFLSDIEIVWPDRDHYDPRYDLYNVGPRGHSFQHISYSRDGETINAFSQIAGAPA